MIKVDKAYVGQASYLLSFRDPQKSVRLEQREAETAFGPMFGGQSQQLNVPDIADPNIARIMFNAGRKSATISQMALQLNLGFDGPDGGIARQLDVIEKNVREFQQRVPAFKRMSDFSTNALVLHINFPSPEAQEVLHEYLYERLIKPEPFGHIASVQTTVGFSVNDLYVNIGVSAYESRQFTASAGDLAASLSNIVQLHQLPVSERGIQVVLDVNNRPRALADAAVQAGEPDELFATLRTTLSDHVPKLVGLTA